MADINFQCITSTKDFPRLSTQYVRTVLNPNPEDSNAQKPLFIYYHNVLPTTTGLRSVGFKQLAPQIGSGEPSYCTSIHRDCFEDRLLVATTAGNNYVLGSDSNWYPMGGTGGSNQVTFAHVHKTTYMFVANTRCQIRNPGDGTMINQVLTGLDVTAIVGISKYSNYLLAHTVDTIFWSSELNPTDFTPSLVTGAGSITPNPVRGKIVYLHETNNGFLIFTSANVVYAKYTGDRNFPFSFTEVLNSGGITTKNHVVKVTNDDNLYFWGTKGCQSIVVSSGACDNVLPELQDFLSSHLIEDYNTTDGYTVPTNTSGIWASQTQSWAGIIGGSTGLKQIPIIGKLEVMFRMIANRYFVVSYGLPTTEVVKIFRWAFVFDMQLKQWGKLKLDHVDCLDLEDTQWSGDQSVSYEPNHAMGFIQPDGSLWALDSEINNTNISDSVVVFGKIQDNRNKVNTLQMVELENGKQSTTNLQVLTSLDGKNFNPPITPMKQIDAPNLQKWLLRTTGINHMLVFTGSFDIVNLQAMLIVLGAR